MKKAKPIKKRDATTKPRETRVLPQPVRSDDVFGCLNVRDQYGEPFRSVVVVGYRKIRGTCAGPNR